MFCSFSWLFLCSDRRKYLDFNFDIHGDGQVVVINFTDGMKFEVLPAFCQLDWLGNWSFVLLLLASAISNMMVNKTVNHNARKMVNAEVVVTNFSYMFTCVE